jgi:hypothetical protein
MRYHNAQSGLELDLSHLEGERKDFYQAAVAKLKHNVDWLEFEDFAFSFSSPIFRTSRSRGEVLSDPLYLAVKDMWLRLGIRQGLVAASKESPSGSAQARKGRTPGAHLASRRRHVAPADQPALPARRRR